MTERTRRRWVVLGGLLTAAVAGWLFARSEPERGEVFAGDAAATDGEPASSDAVRGLRPAIVPRRAAVASAGPGVDGGTATPRIGWGSGPGQLGRTRPREGAPEGPTSLAVDPRGRAWVLDPVNQRVVRFDREGRPEGETALPVQLPQDVALARDGTLVVLDRLADRSVALVGPDGRVRGQLALEGPGLPEAGGATGVFVDDDGVWVEREHETLVRVGDTSGHDDAERPTVPGRPTRDGRGWVHASVVDAAAGRVVVTAWSRPDQEHRYTRELRFGASIQYLLLLDTDRAGVVYLAALTGPEEPGTGAVELVCLASDDGHPLGRATLPPNDGPEEALRELAVLDGGGVVYLHREAEGARLIAADCR